VKEGDGDVVLPERAVSLHPNFVTANGLAQIEERVRALEAVRSAAREAARDGAAAQDAAALAAIERDLRYWMQRKASARLVTPAPDPQVVRFGVAVTLHGYGGCDPCPADRRRGRGRSRARAHQLGVAGGRGADRRARGGRGHGGRAAL